MAAERRRANRATININPDSNADAAKLDLDPFKPVGSSGIVH